MDTTRIGTAGWSIPRQAALDFPGAGGHLARYASRLTCSEINSTFYRLHRPDTYRRWADSVPDSFRFSVKLPRAISHEARFIGCELALDRFLAETAGLGVKRAVVLIQTPPGLPFDAAVVRSFLEAFRQRTDDRAAIEPRHKSWATPECQALLASFGVAVVAADPQRIPEPERSVAELAYFRFHGSPRVYYSDYEPARLVAIAARIAAAREHSRHVWCVFDNTASGRALPNAVALQSLMRA